MSFEALGIHVFAGGFTIGAREVCDIDTHLEVHDLGADTARRHANVDVIRCDSADHWPKIKNKQLVLGNPRCTAFSALTGGCSSCSHGADGKQTRDAVELCKYGAESDADFVVWESVQQAWSVGRPLLERLYNEYFRPRKYRVCHLFINAASFGNPQCRRRYFFVAHRDCYRFNVVPPMGGHPTLAPRPVLWDALEPLAGRTGHHSMRQDGAVCCGECCPYLNAEERHAAEHLPNGWGMNVAGRWTPEKLLDRQRRVWDERKSGMPFSLYCVQRLEHRAWAPTLHSNSRKWLHPDAPRTLSVAELASVMGWPPGALPVGPNPAQQLGKGIVPAVGRWIAEQVKLSLDHHWGRDDWSSTYRHREGQWLGDEDASGRDQKIIDMTQWYGRHRDLSAVPGPAYPSPEIDGLPRRFDNGSRA